MRCVSLLLAAGFSVAQVGCAGSNPYGYDREYVPLSEEEGYLERTAERSYEEIRRDPAGHEAQLVSWFGTVSGAQKRGDQTLINLELRFHQERHLCRDEFDSSCRVTVSQREGGPFSAIVTLRPEDRSGRSRLSAGSLVRIYGRPIADYDDRGGPILQAEYYRHWPHGTYVHSGPGSNPAMLR
ncbi:MAG: hypothetical protein OXU20_10135 [Myxococcales bacterium]|nr:hypothetical protein [Myxococcales bacterium]MDD9966349.1 hypothetical protein [Myxococcales bacterium]